MKLEEYELKEYLSGQIHLIGGKVDYVHTEFCIMPYGYIDILGVRIANDTVYLTIVELKTEEFKSPHLVQLYRYCTGVQELFVNHKIKIKPILVTKKIDGSAPNDVYLINHAPRGTAFFTYEIDIECGISFQKDNRSWMIKDVEWSDAAFENAHLITKGIE